MEPVFVDPPKNQTHDMVGDDSSTVWDGPTTMQENTKPVSVGLDHPDDHAQSEQPVTSKNSAEVGSRPRVPRAKRNRRTTRSDHAKPEPSFASLRPKPEPTADRPKPPGPPKARQSSLQDSIRPNPEPTIGR
jgi:hypothetical protein